MARLPDGVIESDDLADYLDEATYRHHLAVIAIEQAAKDHAARVETLMLLRDIAAVVKGGKPAAECLQTARVEIALADRPGPAVTIHPPAPLVATVKRRGRPNAGRIPADDELLTIQGVAQAAGCSPRTIERAKSAGRLRFKQERRGGAARVSGRAVREWINAGCPTKPSRG